MSSWNHDTPMDLSVKTRRKLRLEEFLRQNLDHAPAGRVIQWVRRTEGVFRILWTHQSSGTFTHKDAALFRYWALARGKPANLSSVELKQSLRMALNKSPSVVRVNAMLDEYRYFQFTDWGTERSIDRDFSIHTCQTPSCDGSPTRESSPPPPPSLYAYANIDIDLAQKEESSLLKSDSYSVDHSAMDPGLSHERCADQCTPTDYCLYNKMTMDRYYSYHPSHSTTKMGHCSSHVTATDYCLPYITTMDDCLPHAATTDRSSCHATATNCSPCIKHKDQCLTTTTTLDHCQSQDMTMDHCQAYGTAMDCCPTRAITTDCCGTSVTTMDCCPTRTTTTDSCGPSAKTMDCCPTRGTTTDRCGPSAKTMDCCPTRGTTTDCCGRSATTMDLCATHTTTTGNCSNYDLNMAHYPFYATTTDHCLSNRTNMDSFLSYKAKDSYLSSATKPDSYYTPLLPTSFIPSEPNIFTRQGEAHSTYDPLPIHYQQSLMAIKRGIELHYDRHQAPAFHSINRENPEYVHGSQTNTPQYTQEEFRHCYASLYGNSTLPKLTTLKSC